MNAIQEDIGISESERRPGRLGAVIASLARLAGSRYALPALATLCASLPLLEHVGLLQLTTLLGVAGCCFFITRRRADGHASTHVMAADDARAPAPSTDAELRKLLESVLPVWLHHIGSVRNQTEEAVTQLVTSFSSINRQFEAAGFGSNTGDSGQGATFSLLTLCERQLHPVVASMTKILDSKKTLVDSVNDLAEATKELASMATDVRLISAHTNILAINAAIEAARAGEAGRGFAVIAKEIRNMAQTSADSGKRVAERMAQVELIMSNAVAAAETASEHDRAVIELSGSVIEDVLTHVREMGSDAESMRENGKVIRGDTENLLVNLQFQDRVSQILTVIDNDLGRLRDVVGAEEMHLPEPHQWLEDLGSQYTMNDQRISATANSDAADAPTEEVVFF
ncbi:MAG: methyl-accepting chemotaxis protein [Caldimonas sp.]